MKTRRPDNLKVGSIVNSSPLKYSEGIFYVVRFPEGWVPVALRFEKGQEAGHPDFWRQQVVPRMALAWSKVLNKPAT